MKNKNKPWFSFSHKSEPSMRKLLYEGKISPLEYDYLMDKGTNRAATVAGLTIICVAFCLAASAIWWAVVL